MATIVHGGQWVCVGGDGYLDTLDTATGSRIARAALGRSAHSHAVVEHVVAASFQGTSLIVAVVNDGWAESRVCIIHPTASRVIAQTTLSHAGSDDDEDSSNYNSHTLQ